jgi:hypothetical protein
MLLDVAFALHGLIAHEAQVEDLAALVFGFVAVEELNK